MRRLTDDERSLLRDIEKKGRELSIQGNYAYHKWDYLAEQGYLHRHSASPNVVLYVLTEKWSAALANFLSGTLPD
jgi:hypothetical protein